MKYSLLSVLVGSLLFVGCDKAAEKVLNDAGFKGEVGDGYKPDLNKFEQDVSTKLRIDKISGIALREALFTGLIDTLVSGTDNAKNGIPCNTGTVQRTGNILHFTQCTGLYEEDTKAQASGDIDISNSSYSYRDFTLTFPTGETQKVNGVLQIIETPTSDTIRSSQITLDMQELSSASKLIPVNYTFTDYKVVWSPTDDKNIQLEVNSKLKSKGMEYGDFNIVFDNSNSIFRFQKITNSVTYPYAGILNINDLNNNDNKIKISAIGINQKAQYTVVGDQNFDKQVAWGELLNY